VTPFGWTGGVRVLSIVRARNRKPADEFCGKDPPEVDAGHQLLHRSSCKGKGPIGLSSCHFKD